MLRIFIITCFLVISCASFSSLPGDNDYYLIERPSYRIIFDEQYHSDIENIDAKIEYYLKELKKTQPQYMDEYLNVVLASPQEQQSNAFANPFPFMKIKIFSSGVDHMNSHAFPLWLDSTFVHELNHLYQMNYSILPDTLNIKTPFFKFSFLYPNILLPNLFIEGEATFKEALVEGLGGRLYSGEVRAFVYAQIKHYQDRPRAFAQKLINEHVHSSSRRMKYLHGSYLFSLLSKKFPHKRISEFFKINGESILSFFTYNHSLRKTFNMDINELIAFYIESIKEEASQQQFESEEPIFKTSVCPEINRFENKILLMTTNLQSTPKLRIYEPRLNKWSTQKIDIPVEKVFKINDQYFSRSTAVTKPHEQVYSIFSEGMKPHPTIHSQFVQDILGDSILSLDTSNNIIGYKLLLNGELYDETQSNALFDSNKNIYYFKQNKNKRTLYKNKKPIFSYFGYYGKLVDILPDGSIYFIAPSTYGSTVYKYLDEKVYRSLTSDRIIQAKTINDKEMVVCEVTGKGDYVYKKTFIDEIEGAPVNYSYSFEKISAFEDNSNQEIEYTDPTDEFSFKNIKKYSPFLHSYLIFSPLLFVWNEYGFYFNYRMIFQDILDKNQLNLSFETQSFLYHQFSTNYRNVIHPFQWSVGYQSGSLDTRQLNFTNPYQSELFLQKYPITKHVFSLDTAYVFFQKGRWMSKILSKKSLQFRELDQTHFIVSSLKNSYNFDFNTVADYFTIEWRSSWKLSYDQSYSMNTYSNKSFDLSITPHYMAYLNNDNIAHVLNTQVEWYSTLHLGYEFYFNPSMKHITSWTHDTIIFNERFLPLVWEGVHTANKLPLIMNGRYVTKYPLEISGKTLFSLGASIFKSINLPIYFSTFPFSLRKIIPSFHINYWTIKKPSSWEESIEYLLEKKHLNLLEFQVGLDLELLAYFKLPFNIGFMTGGTYVIDNRFTPYVEFKFSSNF